MQSTRKFDAMALKNAAIDMVVAHRTTKTMLAAVNQVAEKHPDVTTECLCALWIGVNAKDREAYEGDV